MNEKEYRGAPGVSRSELWRLRQSPEKFKWYQDHPEPATPALIFGQAAHKLLLEPDTFDQEFAVPPELDRRTKAGKEAYNAFLEGSDGKDIIPLMEYVKAQEMVKKALDTPFVEKLLDGKREEPFFWLDRMTGEACKIRVDCLSEIGGRPVIVDYKTTTDASTESFMRSAISYGYDFQAGMYCEGVRAITGEEPIFVFIAQEKTPPYAVNVLQADDLMVVRGYSIFLDLIEKYHACKKSGVWPGYLGPNDVVNTLGLPAWLAREVE